MAPISHWPQQHYAQLPQQQRSRQPPLNWPRQPPLVTRVVGLREVQEMTSA